ncbi:MAG: discoidin domain-containing protein [Lachnospiraceae bacterium]
MKKRLFSILLAMAMVFQAVPATAAAAGSEYEVSAAAESGENLALGKTATANASEVSYLGADKAVDGDTTSRESRWSSSGNAPHWVSVDLGSVETVQSVRLFWETRKVTGYRIQVSEDGQEWTDAKVINARPAALEDIIVLDEPVQARHVRLYIDSFTAEDPDGGVTWNTVSIYEMEIYSGIFTPPVKEEITVDTPQKGDEKLTVNIPEMDGYTTTYNGTDYEQVIGDNLEIYEPIVDTTVKVSFKTVNDKNANDYEFTEVEVTVPGTYQQEEGDNAAPVIIPELREWKGYTGDFTVTDSARIVYADDELKATAEAFAADYEDMTGNSIEVVKGEAADGDFSLTLTEDESKGLQDEGYILEIDEKVTVEAYTATGAYWATRTILQTLKQGENTTMPKGITRDYPLYSVRGLIMDVGRKTFTLDFLEQMVKQLSWYKMNDFQIHLNDNYIFLENYSSKGLDPMDAYSGFRLESDIKEGGNDGKNKADLTSKDVFYTKDEFRDFINESKVYGVNIVPEIDVPAHSLALTKVRPDLRTGTNGRQNDHLDLANQYDDSLEFVQSIFGEYMDGEDPVFTQDTVVHIGCDEYTAAPNAFRTFCNDMLSYVKESGRKPRIWGSLTSIKGDGSVYVDGTGAQMNIWNYGWANMHEMYKLGFELINCNDGHYYIVPNAGYYYDYLNASTLYNAAINAADGVTIPAGDKQMVGGAIALWNDMMDMKENGISEYDCYVRMCEKMGLMAAKLWGKGSMTLAEAQAVNNFMGDAPSTDFGYKAEADENGRIAQFTATDMKELAAKNAEVTTVDYKEALKLQGGESYITTGLETVGLGNDLRVKVKRTSDSTEDQILLESAYGSIKAVQGSTGKVGITRENHDYSFSYELPVNEWVELEFKNEYEVISLYVNGVLTDVIGDGEMAEGRPLKATCMFPTARIGSETKAFVGYVTDLRIGVDAEYASAAGMEMAVLIAQSYLAQGNTNAELSSLIEEAAVLSAQFAPSVEEMAAVKEGIEAILADAEYEKADYSRVEAYLAIVPEDLSVFTPESAAALTAAVDKVQYALPAAMQDMVDSYEAMLRKALSELVLIDNSDSDYYNNALAKVTASSQETLGENTPAKNAIDGQEGTFWHSKWDAAGPHWIQLEMDGVNEIEGFYYLPRQSGTNGNVTSYTIEVSKDGSDYTKVAEGTWKGDASAKTVSFDPVEAKFVRLNVVAGMGGFANAAEIKVCLVPSEKDTADLEALIAEAEELAEMKELFTEESWNVFAEAVETAIAVVNSADSTAKDVETATANLLLARVSLELTVRPAEPENTFTDVSEGDYFYHAVLWAVGNNITEGWTEDTFAPELGCTRGQVVTFLWRANGCLKAENESGFSDVPEDAECADAVAWAVENGITEGWTEDTFAPDRTVTRGQVVTFLWRAANRPQPDQASDFADVAPDAYYADAVAWAVENNITEGWTEDTFAPETECTRGQIVTFLYRAK